MTTEIHPTATGYDLTPMNNMLSWRQKQSSQALR
jgi:hypothetical protein